MLTNLSQNLEDVDIEFPPLWKILANQGVRIGIGGSLNSWPMPADLSQYDFFLPDTFASDAQGFPPEVAKFQDFNLNMVDKSARNVSTGISGGKAIALLPHLLKLGFTLSTAKKIIGQLIAERQNPIRKGRRRILQGVLAFDVFFQQLKSKKPQYTTFFSNHVASSMHRYWASSYAEDFKQNDFDPDWVRTYADEIDFAMTQADDMLEKLMIFAHKNPEYTIVLTTSMGQGANLGKSIARQIYIKDAETFLQKLNVEPDEWQRRRVMLPRFAFITTPQKSELIRQLSSTLKVAGQPVRHEERANDYHMFHFGMENVTDDMAYVEIGNQKFTLEEAGLENTVIEDQSGSSGYHIPTGMWISYDPKNMNKQNIQTEIDTREIAPAVLSHFDVSVPEYMKKLSSSLINRQTP
ncbi:hypothetical protein CRD36_08895 [Paremcibacter congregatus]|uniref:Uncharacterized protein n=2 Tax=Paremcibacter congregatus TaxID=2043170 RepID=A0A2G4YR91_9PROT|nr:hypothetical protein CRD36_08895 [Paremcibacter congregatus]